MKKISFMHNILFRTLLCTVCFVSTFGQVKAGIEPENRDYFKTQESKAIDSFITVFDNKSFTKVGDKTGDGSGSLYASKGYRTYGVINSAYLKINESIDSCFLDTFTFGVHLLIEYKDVDGILFSDTVWLYVNYDTSLLDKNKEISSYIYKDAFWSKVSIIGFSNESYKSYVEIGANQNIERYKNLDFTVKLNLNVIEELDGKNQMKFSWNSPDGDDQEYDFEWAWIDAIDANNDLLATNLIEASFKYNATRVTTSDVFYGVSTAYEKGYIIARVRLKGRNKDKIDQVTYGKWSDADYTLTTVSAYDEGKSLAAIVSSGTDDSPIRESAEFVGTNHEMNWQYVSTFAEEGKRKEVISYYDGSLRNRQSVTRISTDTQAVVGETIYDFEGRPAVNILPVPAFNQALNFHVNFNVSQRTNTAYGRKDFDSIPTNSCGVNVSALSTVSGASKYYSSSNENVSARSDGVIADASGYPMTVTEYMPDGTGRIKKQGGVGTTHQIGTGHETKYYYAVPGPQELDRLFGNDVGDYKHYQKEMVIDPNGQVSVSYKDLSGKVIATSLAGSSPTAVSALNSAANAEVMLSASFGSSYLYSSNEISTNRELLVSDNNTKYQISYGVAIPRVTHEQLPALCFDCVYDLEISLTDECGIEQLDGDISVSGNQPILRTLGKIGEDFDVNCESNELSYSFLTDAAINDTFLTVYLNTGKYSLNKRIKISSTGFDYYLEKFLASDSLKSPEDFVEEALEREDTLSCVLTCDDCLTNLGDRPTFVSFRVAELVEQLVSNLDAEVSANQEYDAMYSKCQAICIDSNDACAGYFFTLLLDVMPKGQYMDYEYDNNGKRLYYNALNAYSPGSNSLSFNYKQHDSSGTWVDIQYKDTEGNLIYVNVNGTDYTPNQLSQADYLKYFKDQWAYSLVKFHPEYCKYEMCDDTRVSQEYDQKLYSVSTYKEAYDSGYLDPFNGLGQDAYFASNSALKTEFKANYFDDYVDLTIGSTTCSVSILELALFSHYSDHVFNNCTELNVWLNNKLTQHIDSFCAGKADAAWEMYRGLLISKKQEFFDAKSGCVPVVHPNYTVRFPDPSTVVNDSLGINAGSITSAGSAEASKGDVQNKIFESCDTICENQADYWLYKLGGCNLSSAIQDSLIADFKEICKNGCDAEHPMGSRNTPGFTIADKRYNPSYNSFEEAFIARVPDTSRVPGDCDIWRINTPSYNSTLMKLAGKRDSCSYENPGDTCFASANEDTKKYINYSSINKEGGCEDCIECDEFYIAWQTLGSKYGGAFVDSTWALKEVMTNYMNSYFGFNLNYFEYEEFANECTSFGGNGGSNAVAMSMPKTEWNTNLDNFNTPIPPSEWLYASVGHGPDPGVLLYQEINTGTGPLLDTCICNQLQEVLDIFEGVDKAAYNSILTEGASSSSLPIFKNWLEHTHFSGSNCELSDPSEVNDFVAALFMCRDIFKESVRSDLKDANQWPNLATEWLDGAVAFKDMRLPAVFSGCLKPCKNNALSSRNKFWDDDIPSGGGQTPSGPSWYNWSGTPSGGTPAGVTCEEFDSTMTSVLAEQFGKDTASFKSEWETFENCFYTSICEIRYANDDWLCNNECSIDDSLGDNPYAITDLYDDVFDRVESNFTTDWEVFPAMFDAESASAEEKIEYIFRLYGKCILLPCDFCYPDGTVVTNSDLCCKDTTIYFKNLLKFLNGFTPNKNILGNQFAPPSGFSIYPDMTSYFGSVFYQGYCPADLTYKIEKLKMPELTFSLEDSCGDKFATQLRYISNYGNNANFGKIVNFRKVNILPQLDYKGCYGTSSFIVLADQLDRNNQIIEVEIIGVISNYELYASRQSYGDSCDAPKPKLCNRPFGTVELKLPDPCVTWKKIRAATSGKIAYDNYIDSIGNDFRTRYYTKCMQAEDSVDMLYDLKEYHYTLYYYDQAGNLTQTVPPQGVSVISNKEILKSVNEARYEGTTKVYPTHTLLTRYSYNTLNEVRWQKTPDGGESQFWYDRLGRMAISQNAAQKDQSIPNFSYTEYDDLGRIREVGQIVAAGITDAIVFDQSLLDNWIENNVKEQITRTYYDSSGLHTVGGSFEQMNLRGRVGTMAYFGVDDDTAYKHAVHYTYDIHGNVNSLLREVFDLHDIDQGYKKIDYEYDLVSGNVNKVFYQRSKDDQFAHRYMYDADNRLIQVETSTDEVHWDRDAKYDYYRHGPLSRTTLGQLKVQGMDYAYTLHGWLKAVNSSTLDASRDIGQDGFAGSLNLPVARDVFGFSLHYYDGDYTSINGSTATSSNYFLMQESVTGGFTQKVASLYNGNISRMITSLAHLSNPTIGKAYEYDQLNRISKSFTFTDKVVNQWQSNENNSAFYSDYSYDANGNILSLNRNAGAGVRMDSLSYHYKSGTNQLTYVDDVVSESAFSNDIDDQAIGNYAYDKIGNLISDVAEEIEKIEWTVYGKIKSIKRISASAKPDLNFEYSPDGHRVAKHVLDTNGQTTSTWYTRDASGNIMATYKREWINPSNVAVTVMDIYDQLVIDQSFNSRLLLLDQQLDWINSVPAANLNTVQSSISNAQASSVLEHFSVQNYLGSTETTAIYDGLIPDGVLAVLHNNGINDPQIYDMLCNTSFTELLIAQITYDFYSFLDQLHQQHPGEFNAITTDLFINTSQPIPNQINDIIMSSDPIYIANFLAGRLGSADCPIYQMIYAMLIGFDHPGSWDVLKSVNGFKTTMWSQYTWQTWLSFFETALGNKNTWDQLFIEMPNTQSSWLSDVKTNEAQAFLFYAMLELEDEVLLRSTVSSMTGKTIEDWLDAIEAQYGVEYTNTLKSTLGYGASDPYWVYKLAENHIYGSSRLGLSERNLPLVQQVIGTEEVEYLSYTNDSVKTFYRGQKRYELSNHLGNVLAVITDRRIQACGAGDVMYYNAQVVSVSDYYPFGMGIKEREWSDSSFSYRFAFQGQEGDDEVSGKGNSYAFKYRIHDPRLGRFFSTDPFEKKYTWNSPYAFSENRVNDSREFEGLEKISIHNYSFAPFDDFAGGHYGDGDNRRFGDKVGIGVKRKEKFRISSVVKLDLATSKVISKQAYGSWSLWSGKPTFSPAKFDAFSSKSGELNYHYSGKDKEIMFPFSLGVMDIDVKLNMTFKKLTDSKNTFKISGTVKGDRFPSNETYLTDNKGQKLFLGVSGPDGMFNEALGPITELMGSGNERMHTFNFKIQFNADESFKEVILNCGTNCNLKDWNEMFTDLNPRDQNIGTNVTNDEVKTDYDPD